MLYFLAVIGEEDIPVEVINRSRINWDAARGELAGADAVLRVKDFRAKLLIAFMRSCKENIPFRGDVDYSVDQDNMTHGARIIVAAFQKMPLLTPEERGVWRWRTVLTAGDQNIHWYIGEWKIQ